MPLLFNPSESKQYRRQLRNTPTRAEVVLWHYLQNRRFFGYKFRRQHGIGPFIVDFFCPKLQLAIEVDGESHFETDNLSSYDRRRQRWIEQQRIWVIRFTDDEVVQDTYGTLERLKKVISSINQHHP